MEDELKNRNQQDHSPSFSGNATTSTIIDEESCMKITLSYREPVMDKVAANKKVLYDPSKQKGSSWQSSCLSISFIIF